MAIKFTRRGYIEVWRDGAKISQHTQEREAIESLSARDPGEYRITYPEVLVRVIGSLSVGGDTEAPSIPTGLTATAINKSRIDLSWGASTDNVAVSGYQLFRDGSPLTTVDHPTTSYSDTTVVPSTTYTYVVAAYDGSGNISDVSASAQATTPANAAPVWSAVPDQDLIIGDSYFLDLDDYCTDADLETVTYTLLSGSLPTGLTLSNGIISGTPTVAGQSSTLSIRAADQFATVDTTVDYATFNADVTAPPVPTGLSTTVISSSQIDVSWSASTDVQGGSNEYVSGTQDYRLYRDGALRTTTSATSYSDTGLSAATEYDYTVSARDVDLNESAQSSVVSATTESGGENPIAATRRTDWTQAGATIINRTTRHGSVIAAGATAATINAALAAAPDNTYVELGAGTFQIGGLSITRSNVTLRGQGMSTIIDFNNGAQDDTPWIWPEGCPFAIAPNPAYNGDVIPAITGAPSGPVTINGTGGVAGSFPAGATVMNLASSPSWAVGDSVCIVMNNYADATLPRVGFFVSTKNVNHPATDGIAWQGEYWNYGAALMYRGTITAISGANVTISPPLPHSLFVSAQTPRMYRYASSAIVSGVGIENLRVVGTRVTPSGGIDCLIGFNRAKECWVKGVGTTPRVGTFHGGNAQNFVVGFKDSYKCSYVNSWQDQAKGGMASGTTTTYGVSTLASAFILVENIIFKNPEAPIVPHVGSVGCVYAYCYEQWVGDDQQETGITFHSVGAVYNLCEGNRVMKVNADLFHGNMPLNTVFRNHHENRGLDLQSYHRFWNMVGCVTDATEVAKTLATDSTKYDKWARYGSRLGYNSQYASIDPNINGSTSLDGVAHDPYVWTSFMDWGNYTTIVGTSFSSSGVPSSDATFPNPVPSSQSLPASMFRTSRPGYFTITGVGTQPWPLIGPDVTGGDYLQGHAYKTPAQLMYELAGGSIANFDPSLYG